MKKNKTMLNIFRIILLLGTVFSLTKVPWPIVKAWIKPLPKTVQEQVNYAIDYGFDGMIVYVDKNGKPPAFYTAGYKDRDKKIPADPKSLFKIASISKLYVAVSIAKLSVHAAGGIMGAKDDYDRKARSDRLKRANAAARRVKG